MMSMSSSIENAFQFDSHAFTEAMSFSGDENDFMSIISSMMTSEQDSYDNNIKKLGYAENQQVLVFILKTLKAKKK